MEDQIPYVQRIRRADGSLDLYFRKGAYRRRLQAADGSDDLRDEVNAVLASLAAVERAKTPRAGTVRGMLKAYNRSAEYLALARSTQSEYQRLIDELETDAGDILLSEVTTEWVRDMRDAWMVRGYKAANDRLTVLHNALQPAIEDDRVKVDPFAKIKRAKRPHDAGEAHPTWEDAEVLAGIQEALSRKMPGLARAIALGRYGGFRRQTICSLPLNARVTAQHLDGYPERRLYWLTEKRKVLADKREDPRLTKLLESTPNQALTIAYNARGGAWKPRQLNQAIDRLMVALAKKGKARADIQADGTVETPLTIHGLRHARGVELAMSGASDAEIMTQLEHATDRAAKIYRRQASRRQLADNAQDRVDAAVELAGVRRRRAGSTASNT